MNLIAVIGINFRIISPDLAIQRSNRRRKENGKTLCYFREYITLRSTCEQKNYAIIVNDANCQHYWPQRANRIRITELFFCDVFFFYLLFLLQTKFACMTLLMHVDDDRVHITVLQSYLDEIKKKKENKYFQCVCNASYSILMPI